jgi:hypothetical protein
MSPAEIFWLHAMGYGLLGCASALFLDASWQAWRHRHRRTHARTWLTFTSIWPDED